MIVMGQVRMSITGGGDYNHRVTQYEPTGYMNGAFGKVMKISLGRVHSLQSMHRWYRIRLGHQACLVSYACRLMKS